MPLINKQDHVTIHQLDGMFRITVETFIVSILAARREDEGILYDHKAFLAPNSISTPEQAEQAGIEEAERIWSKEEGWFAHSADVASADFTFDVATSGS